MLRCYKYQNFSPGYAKMNGVPEVGVGIVMGFAALFGIFGTVMYPIMRRRLSLHRTGIFGLSLQVACLVPCVISVWMPGSKFDLSLSSELNATLLENDNCTHSKSTVARNVFKSFSLTNFTLDIM